METSVPFHKRATVGRSRGHDLGAVLGRLIGGRGSKRRSPEGRKPDQEDGSNRTPVWKRMEDWVLLMVGLPIVAPIFLGVWLWIRLTSKGKVFFYQVRVGKDGKEFTMVKFRTMREGVDSKIHDDHMEDVVGNGKPMEKLDCLGDSRLIPGGCILRSSGLDELPQLFNVARGEMSLVGPRPCTKKEFLLYGEDQKRRFQVLPGLTGYWQVTGKNRMTFPQMIAADEHYVAKRSLALDLWIIARTPVVLIAQLVESAKARCRRQKKTEASASTLVTPIAKS